MPTPLFIAHLHNPTPFTAEMRKVKQTIAGFIVVATAVVLIMSNNLPFQQSCSQLAARLSFWAMLYPFIPFGSIEPAHVVDVGYARYIGDASYPNAVAYLGIPYAEPPIGERRFRAPLPLDTARMARQLKGKIVDATAYPDFCVQGSTGSGDAGGAGTEDCLKLNVYAPAGAEEGDDLPVLVYIHGGGYAYGNPANWPFDHWINQSPNVIIVSVYYRLDSFGFLAVPELSDGVLGDLNTGFQDQILALKWVQDHIRSFGGDPSRVTINGQSAGAASVQLHLVAHEGEKLYSQAIVQSVYRTPLPMPEQQRPLFDFYASSAGCGESSDSVTTRMACLRKASVSALSRAQDAAVYNFTGHYKLFRPVVDGMLITDFPTLSILGGDLADVPIIVGATSNETLSRGPDISSALHKFFPGLTSNDLAEYLEHYPAADFESDNQRFTVATGESELICSVRLRHIRLFSKIILDLKFVCCLQRAIIGSAASRDNKVFTYRYNQPVPTFNTTLVTHAAENWMFFRGTLTGTNGTTTFQPQSASDKAFASELIAYWLSFVRSGDPNTYKLSRSPAWPQYTPDRLVRVVLQESGDTDTSGTVVEDEPGQESERCTFVASKASHQQA
ncbi:alpha/beta-hydrolase [Cubamyces sp. BRFM 1775]|nr:alpha/beta-hydrolase [Cubamyces sp. BRFM 1775]